MCHETAAAVPTLAQLLIWCNALLATTQRRRAIHLGPKTRLASLCASCCETPQLVDLYSSKPSCRCEGGPAERLNRGYANAGDAGALPQLIESCSRRRPEHRSRLQVRLAELPSDSPPAPVQADVLDISPEATEKLREAGDVGDLWGTAQFGLASVNVLMRIEALPGDASLLKSCNAMRGTSWRQLLDSASRIAVCRDWPPAFSAFSAHSQPDLIILLTSAAHSLHTSGPSSTAQVGLASVNVLLCIVALPGSWLGSVQAVCKLQSSAARCLE